MAEEIPGDYQGLDPITGVWYPCVVDEDTLLTDVKVTFVGFPRFAPAVVSRSMFSSFVFME